MRLLLFMLAGLALAVLAGFDAARAHWRSDQAGPAPAFWAEDAGVRLRASDKLLAQPREFAAQAPAIAAAAREVLRRTPLDVLAMRQLAALEVIGRTGAARDHIALAERISRRDFQTELLSIDLAATQPDVAATLRHYHHALATFPLANRRLLPIVASQLGEPDVRQALVVYADQPWLRHFVANAVEYDVTPADLMAFYALLEDRVPTGELQAARLRLLQWLVSFGQYAALGTYAQSLPGLAPDAFAPIGLNATTTDPRFAPLSWSLVNDATVGTEADGNAMLVRIEPGGAAIAATRLTLLEPGEYVFAHRSDHAADTPPARLEWQVSCPDSPLQQLLAAPSQRAGAGSVQQLTLTIPAGCEAQYWQLRAAAAPSQFASGARVSDLMLVRR